MSDFLRMGGYAVYVWSSFGVLGVVVIWNLVAPYLRRGDVMRQLTQGEDSPGDRD